MLFAYAGTPGSFTFRLVERYFPDGCLRKKLEDGRATAKWTGTIGVQHKLQPLLDLFIGASRVQSLPLKTVLPVLFDGIHLLTGHPEVMQEAKSLVVEAFALKFVQEFDRAFRRCHELHSDSSDECRSSSRPVRRSAPPRPLPMVDGKGPA